MRKFLLLLDTMVQDLLYEYKNDYEVVAIVIEKGTKTPVGFAYNTVEPSGGTDGRVSVILKQAFEAWSNGRKIPAADSPMAGRDPQEGNSAVPGAGT